MKNLLIIEDEYQTREGLAKLITRLDVGYKVTGEAEDGLEGLRLIQEIQPDVVITDIRMPKMSGLEMIERAKEVSPHTQYVILSGFADFSYAQTAMSLGVKEYLLKPVTISDVRTLLERLDGNRMEKETEQPVGKSPEMEEYSPAVRRTVDILQKEYAQPVRLENVADRLKITPQYLSNLFARETGMTFSNYLRMIRMENAKELLKKGDRKIYEVAVSVGYPDQKYFSRVFRDYTGKSAREYLQAPEEADGENGQGKGGNVS